jgi:precorrin-2 dehydrogenase/sirohydrochlorin ferrochelatase
VSLEKFNYPIYVSLENKTCLVVGGGKVALRKTKGLLKAKGTVTVIADKFLPDFYKLKESLVSEDSKDFRLILKTRKYLSGDTKGFFLVFSATNNTIVNRLVADEARANNILSNISENPSQGSFIVPARTACGKIEFTVKTGASPVFTKLITKDLKKHYGGELEEFRKLITTLREELKTLDTTTNERQEFWRTVITEKTLEQVNSGKFEEVKETIEDAISCFRSKS